MLTSPPGLTDRAIQQREKRGELPAQQTRAAAVDGPALPDPEGVLSALSSANQPKHATSFAVTEYWLPSVPVDCDDG